MTATLTTATGRTHRLSELREVIGNYYVADGDRDRGAFGAKARTACGRTYEGLAFPDGSGVTATCTKCEAAEEPAEEPAEALMDRILADNPSVARRVAREEERTRNEEAATARLRAVDTPRYVAVRRDGRYRVIDADGQSVATCASLAKAEEKAARLNAEAAEDLAPGQPGLMAAIDPAAAAQSRPVAPEAPAEAALERRELALAAAKVITEAPAEETKAYRVGKRLAEYATEATTRPGTPLASLIGKLEAKTPAKDGTRLVHVTLSEALALSGVAEELEGRAREEVTAGDLSAVSLVFSCTSAQAALRKLFLG